MLIIEWDINRSITSLAGGDVIPQRRGVLYIDGTSREEYIGTTEVTTHPVEEGFEISDHVRGESRTVTLDCVISSNPTNILLQARTPAAVRETLENLRYYGAICSITNDDNAAESYHNMLITSLRETRDDKSGDSLFVTIDFQEVRQVETQIIAAPSPRVERARPRAVRAASIADVPFELEYSNDAAVRATQVPAQRQAVSALHSIMNW